MPIAYLRHAATAKNIDGGTDDEATPLHDDGVAQALAMGPRLLEIARMLGAASIRPITSGHVRAVATWELAAQAFAGSEMRLSRVIGDSRIGEIKFKPREIVPTVDNPGLFGRAIDGPPLKELLGILRAFADERLENVAEDEWVIVVGHRSTTRVLAMVHAGLGLDWLETLPRMNNCELWLATATGLKVLHQGFLAERDAIDPRRGLFFPYAQVQN